MASSLPDIVRGVIAAAWAMPEIQIIVWHSLINFVAGVVAALNDSTFHAGKLWEVFGKKIVPFAALYFVARAAGDVVLGGMLPALVFGAIEAALLSDLIDSLARVPGLAGVVDALPRGVKGILLKR